MAKVVSKRGPELRQALIEAIANGSKSPVNDVASSFRVSRQGLNRHLRVLVQQGLLKASGTTRARRYELVESRVSQSYPLQDLTEDRVWRQFVQPHLGDIPPNVRKICQHGVTEMVNNSIDHSGGTRIDVTVVRSAAGLRIVIFDNGVGIFRKIRDAAGLEDERLAALELAKGKFTTDPLNHSGEGIFFTSRMFDEFSILSHCLFFFHDPGDDDWLMEDQDDVGSGTYVQLQIAVGSNRTVNEVFEKFALPDAFAFSVTHVPVGLARIGKEQLVSRSQAKRLLNRLEKFDKVLLNFEGVDAIGQAFADEVFRVFPLNNPGTAIDWMKASPDVERMIRRVIDAREVGPPAQPGLFDGADQESRRN